MGGKYGSIEGKGMEGKEKENDLIQETHIYKRASIPGAHFWSCGAQG